MLSGGGVEEFFERGFTALLEQFNREQQASMCEDYYDVTHGLTPDYGATKPELDPFIADMRARKF